MAPTASGRYPSLRSRVTIAHAEADVEVGEQLLKIWHGDELIKTMERNNWRRASAATIEVAHRHRLATVTSTGFAADSAVLTMCVGGAA